MDLDGQLTRLAKARQTRPLASWGLLFALFALALAARAAFSEQLAPVPFLPFFLAVLIAAVICAWRKTIALAAASTFAGWLFFVRRPSSFNMSPSFDVRVAAFLLASGIAIALIEGLVQAVLRLEASARLNGELFRELQHRVANNFQIVSATLQKAQRETSDPATFNAVEHAIERMNSLAQLHRRLYDSRYYAKGLAHVLGEVLGETFHDVSVEVRLDVTREPLTVSQMTSIVLLVNEAAINALKHVFRLNRGRNFSVVLAEEKNKRLLIIQDDGPGFGPMGPDAEKPRFGLLVMRGLAAQLGGVLEIEDGPGGVIRVTF